MEQLEEGRIKRHEEIERQETVRTFALLPAGLLLSIIFLMFGLLRLNSEIANLKEANDLRRDNEARLRLAMDAAGIGDWSLDLGTRQAAALPPA